jgi:hypothetical protein
MWMAGTKPGHDARNVLRSMTYQITFLREQPQHLTSVAEWIHRQWWSETDTPAESIER